MKRARRYLSAADPSAYSLARQYGQGYAVYPGCYTPVPTIKNPPE